MTTWRTVVALAILLAVPAIVVAEQLGPTHVRDYEGYAVVDGAGIAAFGVTGFPAPTDDGSLDVGRVDLPIPAGAGGLTIAAEDTFGEAPNILVRFWWPTIGEVPNTVVCSSSPTFVNIGQQGSHGKPHEVHLYVMPPTADPDDPLVGPPSGPDCPERTWGPTGTITVEFFT